MNQNTSTQSPTLFHKLSFAVVTGALIFIFASSAVMKLSNDETIVNNFSKWNLLAWKNFIAAIELAGALFLILKKLRLIGSLLLSAIMAGAIFTHLQHSEPFYFPFAILLVIWINYYLIRPKN